MPMVGSLQTSIINLRRIQGLKFVLLKGHKVKPLLPDSYFCGITQFTSPLKSYGNGGN